MAKFDAEIPVELMNSLQGLELNAEKFMGDMVNAGGDVVLRNVRSNMRSSYRTTRSLEQGLHKTRVYKTPSSDGIAVKVGFSGYSSTRKGTGRNKQYGGQPIPLVAWAREKGTSRGELRKPFFRKSFNKGQIEQAMRQVEDRILSKMR